MIFMITLAKKLNESCELNEECQYLAGPNAECFKPWHKCRCNRHTVPTKISGGFHHCISLGNLSLHINQSIIIIIIIFVCLFVCYIIIAQLHNRCLYSKECSLAGDSRYCNASYLCDCLPGYKLEGRFCANGGGGVNIYSFGPVALLLLLLSYYYYHHFWSFFSKFESSNI